MTTLRITEVPQKPMPAVLRLAASRHLTLFMLGALVALCLVWMWTR